MQTGEFLDLVLGEHTGYLALAVGHARRTDDGDFDRHDPWREIRYAWPAERAKALAFVDKALARDAPLDVYFTPAVRTTDARRKGDAVAPSCCWVDLDTAPEDKQLLKRLRPVVVRSGSAGRAHLYVPLTEPVDVTTLTRLNKALAHHLGGDKKWSDESLLRVPGTANHKTVPGNPVAARDWHGQRWAPDDLAALLDADQFDLDEVVPTDRAAAGDDDLARWRTDGQPCAHVSTALSDACAEFDSAGRHDSARDGQLALLRLGEQGHAGVDDALDQLYDTFAEALGGDRVPDGEWHRGLLGAARIIAAAPSDDAFLTGTARHDRRARRAAAARPDGDDDWPEPAPLKPPPLGVPLEAVPGSMRRLLDTVAESKQVPTELVLLTALAAISACCSGGKIEIRPGYSEQLSAYTMAVEHSGGRKSPVLSQVASYPLRDACHAVAADPEIATLATRKKVAEAKLDRIWKDLAKAAPTSTDEDLVDAQAELDEINAERPAPDFLITEGTIEAVEQVMTEQHGPCAIFAAEGGLVETLAGRYSEKGKGSGSIAALNSAYTGEPHRVARVKGSRMIDHPSAAIGLIVQPSVLADFAENGAWQRNGLHARWWYAAPATKVGTRSADAPALDPAVIASWSATLEHLLRRHWLSEVGVHLRLSDDALAIWREYHGLFEPKLAELDRDSGEGTWLAKWSSHLTRMAGLLALSDDADATVVTGDYMQRAGLLVQWLYAEARRAFNGGVDIEDADEGVDIGAAVSVLQWLQRRANRQRAKGTEQPRVFASRDVKTFGPGAVRRWDMDAIDALLDVLAEARWIRAVEAPARGAKGGRTPSPKWEARADLDTHLAALRATERGGVTAAATLETGQNSAAEGALTLRQHAAAASETLHSSKTPQTGSGVDGSSAATAADFPSTSLINSSSYLEQTGHDEGVRGDALRARQPNSSAKTASEGSPCCGAAVIEQHGAPFCSACAAVIA